MSQRLAEVRERIVDKLLTGRLEGALRVSLCVWTLMFLGEGLQRRGQLDQAGRDWKLGCQVTVPSGLSTLDTALQGLTRS